MSSAENFTQMLSVSNWSTRLTTSFENEVLCAYVRYHAMNHPPANICKVIQYNLNGSNTDGSFTVDDSNSFFSPYKILPIAQENKYLGIFFLFHYGIVCCVYSL